MAVEIFNVVPVRTGVPAVTVIISDDATALKVTNCVSVKDPPSVNVSFLSSVLPVLPLLVTTALVPTTKFAKDAPLLSVNWQLVVPLNVSVQEEDVIAPAAVIVNTEEFPFSVQAVPKFTVPAPLNVIFPLAVMVVPVFV